MLPLQHYSFRNQLVFLSCFEVIFSNFWWKNDLKYFFSKVALNDVSCGKNKNSFFFIKKMSQTKINFLHKNFLGNWFEVFIGLFILMVFYISTFFFTKLSEKYKFLHFCVLELSEWNGNFGFWFSFLTFPSIWMLERQNQQRLCTQSKLSLSPTFKYHFSLLSLYFRLSMIIMEVKSVLIDWTSFIDFKKEMKWKL